VYTNFNISSEDREEWEEATNNGKRLRNVTEGCSQTFYTASHLQDTHLQVTPLRDTPLLDTPLLDIPLRDTLLQGTLHRVVILQSIMHHMVTLNMGLRQGPILLHMVAICLRVPLQDILPKGSPPGLAWGNFLLEVQQLQLQLMVLTN
jgi:hypothetical protein